MPDFMRTLRRRAAAVAWLAVLAPAAATAQQPTGAPPPAGGEGQRGPEVHELLPDIGRIGAQGGVMAGASWNPYDVGRGIQAAGYIDLPLARAPGGKVSYEIVIGLSHATSDPFTITNPLAYLANLAAGATPEAALAGPPGAPFPVRRAVRTRLRLMEVSPFGLKYTVRRWDHARLRPYAAAGLDFAVVITRQTPLDDESLVFTGKAPFDDPLIGGVVAQAPELEARGTPSGQGNIELGWHAGGGLEIRVARGLSLNLDYRFLRVGGESGRLHAVSSALGFHW
jgi:opacity protein-like surface antigen